ncbi:MAG: hypothetical protein A2854_04985 [Parcubacteria group bacterium RIFCSPHIGHO2_01_FULL_56_18]|nr:MAG: hypothetical protein A2854_04985 [Parcubacteria group bacterium RIFCSPHIGHO2_01_FULL_56_18]
MSDLGSFFIRVVDKDGDPVEGVKIWCKYQAGGVGSDHTDSDGWAEFKIYHGFSPSSYGIEMIWINDEEVIDEMFFPDDGDKFSFTLSDDD